MSKERIPHAVREETRPPVPSGDESDYEHVAVRPDDHTHAAALAWLRSEFPEWNFEVGVARTMSRGDMPSWVAKKEGHHPQSELTPGKLYSRLTDYLVRETHRSAHRN